MQSQTLSCPTDHELHQRDNLKRLEASLNHYRQQCSYMSEMISDIARIARAGERVDLIDAAGQKTSLVLAPPEGESDV